MVEISVVNQDAGDFMARSVAEETQTARLNQEFRDAQSHVFSDHNEQSLRLRLYRQQLDDTQ